MGWIGVLCCVKYLGLVYSIKLVLYSFCSMRFLFGLFVKWKVILILCLNRLMLLLVVCNLSWICGYWVRNGIINGCNMEFKNVFGVVIVSVLVGLVCFELEILIVCCVVLIINKFWLYIFCFVWVMMSLCVVCLNSLIDKVCLRWVISLLSVEGVMLSLLVVVVKLFLLIIIIKVVRLGKRVINLGSSISVDKLVN